MEAVKILAELKAARSDEARLRSARRLREWVRVESRGGTDSNFTAALTMLNNRIFDLINSSDPNDKLGGIAAIYELTDEPVPDNETKIVRFANYLRVVAPSTSDPAVLRLAAKALGHLARAGGTMTADFVEYEGKRALEWLQAIETRVESRKLASVLILRELAENAPTLFYPQISFFFAHIWTALSDAKVHIRESAARALSSCLALVTRRFSKSRETYYGSLFKIARTALQGGGSMTAGVSGGGGYGGRTSTDVVHGALLTLGELLNNELVHASLIDPSERLLNPLFNELCELVLKYRDHKDRLIRRTVIVLLPRLAHYSPEPFVRGYADIALAHLLTCLRDVKQIPDRGTPFIAIGRIALAVGSHLASDGLRSQLERIVAQVRDGLTPVTTGGGALGRSIKRPFVPEALSCVAMLSKAVGPALMEHMHELIDPMFSDGLSIMLTEALHAVAASIPALKPLLQERLLHELSLLLANRPFVPPFADPTPVAHLPFAAVLDAGMDAWGAGGVAAAAGAAAVAAAPAASIPALTADHPAAGPWNAYGALAGTGLSALSAATVVGDGAAAIATGPPSLAASLLSTTSAALSAISQLIGGPPIAGGFADGGGGGGGGPSGSGGAAGGSGGGGGGGGPGGMGGTGGMVLPLAHSTPTTMSWAKNLPSAMLGSGDGGGGGGGGGGASGGAAGGGGFGTGTDPGAPVTLASTRGVPRDSITLALHILGTFDFSGVPLLPFLREVVLLYLDDDDPAIRLEAGLTCCRLMVRPTDLTGRDVDPLLANSGFDLEVAAFDTAATEAAWELDVDDEDAAAMEAVLSRLQSTSDGATASVESKGGDAAVWEAKAKMAADLGLAADGTASAEAWGLDTHFSHRHLGASEVSRQRKLQRQHAAFMRRLRPPQHPLLVYGTDTVSVGISMGDYTSPVALALAGYEGGYADAAKFSLAMAGLSGPGASSDAAAHASPADLRAAASYGSILASVSSVMGTGPTMVLLSQLLQRLVMMAITDPDPAVRFEVLASLDPRFDVLLVEEENLRLLCQGLHDENYACREAVLALVGRLTAHNPAHIMPILRRTLFSVLAELEYADAHPDVAPLPPGMRGGGGSASNKLGGSSAAGGGGGDGSLGGGARGSGGMAAMQRRGEWDCSAVAPQPPSSPPCPSRLPLRRIHGRLRRRRRFHQLHPGRR